MKIAHELFIKHKIIFSIYYHQATDLIEYKIYKPLPRKSKKRPPQNVCSIFFENEGVEFINIARNLRDPGIAQSLALSSVKFPVNGNLQTGSNLFNFDKFVNNLDLDLFLTDPDSLPCKCRNSPFSDRYHKHIVTGDPRIIKNKILRKRFIKRTRYKEVRPINSEKSKRFILKGLDNCILSWCYKNDVDISFF